MVERALQVFAQLRLLGLQPAMMTYITMVCACGRVEWQSGPCKFLRADANAWTPAQDGHLHRCLGACEKGLVVGDGLAGLCAVATAGTPVRYGHLHRCGPGRFAERAV